MGALHTFTKRAVKKYLFPNSDKSESELFETVYRNNIPEALRYLALHDYVYGVMTEDERNLVKKAMKIIQVKGIIPKYEDIK